MLFFVFCCFFKKYSCAPLSREPGLQYDVDRGLPQITAWRYIMKQALEIFLTLTAENRERAIAYLREIVAEQERLLAAQEKEKNTSE